MMISRNQRIGRIFSIISKNILMAPIYPRAIRQFLWHIYEFDPIDPQSSRIPNTTLFEHFPQANDETVTLKRAFVEHGNMTHEELYSICLLACCVKPQSIFEFGTFNGNTTYHLALNTPPETRLWTLNLPGPELEIAFTHSEEDRRVVRQKERSGERFHNTSEAARITQLFGDSARFDYSPYYGQMDFVLVDAGHDYPYVKSDTENALKMLGSTGWILWHDYPNALGVATYLHELAVQHKIFRIRNTRLAFAQIVK